MRFSIFLKLKGEFLKKTTTTTTTRRRFSVALRSRTRFGRASVALRRASILAARRKKARLPASRFFLV